MPPIFIVFEGGEGAGKSTQVQRLGEHLSRVGRHVITTREPGATALGQRIRDVLLDPSSVGIDFRAEALLYAADRAHHVATVIRPALADGKDVVSDRYVDSTLAYQGAGRALDADGMLVLSRWATGGLTPDLTIVLDIDPRRGLLRSGRTDRLEAEPLDFHDRVRSEFLSLAVSAPDRYLVIDAEADIDVITTIVRERVDELMRDLLMATSPEDAPSDRAHES
jgi:dTMP kinase